MTAISSSPAIGFIGYEGQASQVVFGCDNGNVYVLRDFNGAAQCIGTFRCGNPGDNTTVRSTPAIANIDTINNPHHLYGDLPEVIVGATDGKLYALSFANGNGVNLPWSPIAISPGIPIFSSPAVADIDHEPDLEILIGANNNLHLIRAFKSAALVPVAKFTAPAAQRGGNPPLEVSFTDQSTNNPISWLWDFGDDCTSTDKDPNHIYNVPGTYDVSLTVVNAHGSNSVTESDYITVNPVPVAAFTYTPVSGTVPLQVDFSDQSQYGPTSWSWNFGDGNTSEQQNPSHVYERPGNYMVSLTVSNSTGSDTKINSFYIRVGCYLCDFDHDGIVDFTDLELLVNDWLRTNSIFVADIAPLPNGDGKVNLTDFALFAQYWFQGGTAK